jgi:hypothetical protein
MSIVPEKESDVYAAPPLAEQALVLERDWTPHEEAKAKRKLDIIMMVSIDSVSCPPYLADDCSHA